jgi:hypothetical protein
VLLPLYHHWYQQPQINPTTITSTSTDYNHYHRSFRYAQFEKGEWYVSVCVCVLPTVHIACCCRRNTNHILINVSLQPVSVNNAAKKFLCPFWTLERVRCYLVQWNTFMSKRTQPVWRDMQTQRKEHTFYYHYSALGPIWQEPEPSQATGMALVRWILGKFLGVVCHCFPLYLDVPTLAARCLHVPNNASAPSSERWNYRARNGRQILPVTKLPCNHRVLLHAAILQHGANGFTSLPKEGMLRIFSHEKNPTASAGFEPANSGTRGQHANH